MAKVRIYNLPNEVIPDRFVLKQEGHNKESRFRVEENAGNWTAYSWQMPIAIWVDDKVVMPLEDSDFDLNVSKRTAQHMSDIFWRVRKSEIEVLKFIPAFGDDYNAGEGAREMYRGRYNAPETISFRHLVIPTEDGEHWSSKSWKTENGAWKNALNWVDSYAHLPNFLDLTVKLAYKSWHIVLKYKKFELT